MQKEIYVQYKRERKKTINNKEESGSERGTNRRKKWTKRKKEEGKEKLQNGKIYRVQEIEARKRIIKKTDEND